MRRKNAAEVKGILKANGFRDLVDLHVCIAQHRLGIGKSDHVAVFHRTFACPSAEATVKIGRADSAQRGIIGDIPILIPFVFHCLNAVSDRRIGITVGAALHLNVIADPRRNPDQIPFPRLRAFLAPRIEGHADVGTDQKECRAETRKLLILCKAVPFCP